MQDPLPATDEAIRFGPFLLYPARQVLLRDGAAVRLGERAFQLLCLLVERAGNFVTSEEILRRLWPGAEVSDGTVRVHLSALRKVLGDGHEGRRFIVNAHNRGYCFVALLQGSPVTIAPTHVLPSPPPVSLFGRQADLEQTVRKLRNRRLVTLVGPGGVGKTALAIAATQRLLAHEESGMSVCHLDLSGITEPGGVLPAIRIALGLEASAFNAMAGLLDRLKTQPVLLVFDGCDRVLAEVAAVVEHLIAADSPARVLVTSRELLCVDDECLQYVDPLDSGGPSFGTDRESAAQAMFRARFEAIGGAGYTGTVSERAAWQICRLLDGLPLSIELAAEDAARVGLLATHNRLMHELGSEDGRELGTLDAPTCGWWRPVDESLALLSPTERRVCLRLAAFDGAFSLEDAAAVASPSLPPPAVLEALMSLVDKSLVRAHAEDDELTFHLLNTTRRRALGLDPGEAREARQCLARCRPSTAVPEPCAA